MKNICSIFALMILILSVFSISQVSSFTAENRNAFGISAGQVAQQKTLIPAELTSSIINSGNPPSTDNFNITKGYTIEPVLWNLTLPSSVAFDEKGTMYIAESGFGFTGLYPIPRILKIDDSGTISVLTDRFLNGPIVDMVYHKGKLYVASKAKISTVDPATGAVTDIIVGMPTGDHPVTQIAFGKDGRLYFAQGSATNSGVVGIDNYLLGWLPSFPMVHDVPGKDVTLTGQNFKTSNIVADGPKKFGMVKDLIVNVSTPVEGNNSGSNDNNDNSSSGKGTADIAGNITGNVTTGAFIPFGNATKKGQMIKGDIKCTGCILSAKEDGSDLRLVAWGLRLDIFSGLTFDKEDKLIVADSGSEERGSRPIRNDHDKIWRIDVSNSSNMDKFYGWPDFFYPGGQNKSLLSVTDPQFQSPRGGGKPLQFLMQNHPPVEKVFADPGYAVKMTKAELSNSSKAGTFGFKDMVLMSEYGTHAPFTHVFEKEKQIKQYIPGNTNKTIVGQKVIAVNTKSGNITDFISLKKPDPSFRPVDLEFSPDGNALYIVSFGKSEHRITLPNGEPLSLPTIWSYPNTGIIWKVANSTTIAAAEPPPKALHISPELTITINSGKAPSTSIFNLPSGYKIEPILWNLNLPGSFAFDDKGNMYIAEVGYAYVGLTPPPRILKVDHQTGNVSVFVDRGLDRPLTDISFHNGKLYVSNGGRVSTVDMKGIMNNIIVALPGIGDHYVDQIAFGSDGRFYFGIGTATNSGIVGNDNPWIKFLPQFHEIPGKNITLGGVNFKSRDYLYPTSGDNTTTGAYVPFGTSTNKGQVIKGDIKCNGCILSANLDGTDIRLVAWGLRHPYGLAFGEDGKLIVSMNGVDERGSRNIANDGDKIYIIDTSNSTNFGKWYGWPDFFGTGEPVTDPQFESPKNNQTLKFLMQDHPPVQKPVAVVDVGTGLTQVVYNNSTEFGFNGKALIAEFGTLAPQTHLTAANSSFGPSIGTVMGQTIGQKIIIFDPKTGNINDFISLNTADSTFRPTGLQFSPDHKSLYIASVGNNVVRTITPSGAVLPFPLGLPWAYPYTGVIWKVTHS